MTGGKEADGTIKPGSVAVLGEKAEGDVTFTSVFKKKVTHKTGPRVLEGQPVAEPAVAKGQEYLFPPTRTARSAPCRSSAAGPCWARALASAEVARRSPATSSTASGR